MIEIDESKRFLRAWPPCEQCGETDLEKVVLDSRGLEYVAAQREFIAVIDYFCAGCGACRLRLSGALIPAGAHWTRKKPVPEPERPVTLGDVQALAAGGPQEAT